MEEKKPEVLENKPENKDKETKIVKKRLNKKRIIIAGSIILIVIVALLVLRYEFIKPGQRNQIVTINYKIVSGDAILDEGEGNFAINSIADNFGFQSNKIDEEIATMRLGETKTITLASEDAYGDYDEDLVNEINRTEKLDRIIEINRTIEITETQFKQAFDEEPIEGKTYSQGVGLFTNYKVISVEDNIVKISIETEEGESAPDSIPNIDVAVKEITPTKIILEREGEDSSVPTDYGVWEITLDDDYVYLKLNPLEGEEITIGYFTGYVTSIDDENIVLDGNNPYAGKSISFEVTLLEKIYETIETGTGGGNIPNAPTLQVFIMSYCPYGIQMLKGLLPVWKEFGDKANIELRFVGYTMHGQEEDQENYRMMCIREEQYSKLIPYLECFAQSGDSASCLIQANVDETKLNSCVTSNVATYYEEDKELNDLYGVSGSPTTILDSEEVQIYPRSPQDIADALCAAFTTKPQECSQQFSTENPSPGFGGGTGTGSGGSCG